MMRALIACSFGLLALAGAASFVQAENEREKLRHDPFARPALATLQQRAVVLPGTQAPQRPPAASGPAMTLHAVMVAGPDSIANVDGIIVRIGEQVHGYRLIAVQDRTAIFEKDRIKITVSMRGSVAVARDARQEKQ